MGVRVGDFTGNENPFECFLCCLLCLVTEIFIQNVRCFLACERKGTPRPMEPFIRVIRRSFSSFHTLLSLPLLQGTRR